jgi:hypothetical protein
LSLPVRDSPRHFGGLGRRPYRVEWFLYRAHHCLAGSFGPMLHRCCRTPWALGEMVSPIAASAIGPLRLERFLSWLRRVCRDGCHSQLMRGTVPLMLLMTPILARFGLSPDIEEGMAHQEAWGRGSNPCLRAAVALRPLVVTAPVRGRVASHDTEVQDAGSHGHVLRSCCCSRRAGRDRCVSCRAMRNASLTRPPPSARGAARHDPSFAALTFPGLADEDMACRSARRSRRCWPLGDCPYPVVRW